jgi:DNA-binding CsgD family transcriptional regulator
VPAVQKTEHPDLTRRELEILRLVAEGLSNAELAKMLWVTEQTVKFHLSNIYRKLNVSNRTEASRWAQLNGLLPAEPMRSALV